MFGERIQKSAVGIGKQKHVGFIDGLKPPDAGAVKADPFLKKLRCEL